jgi:enamine deaminase RidA (YjgF/YER057c/UK114 family)
MSAEAKWKEMKLELPAPAKPAGVYAPLVFVGNLVYTSGHVSINADGSRITGKVGRDLTKEEGHKAARATALAILSTLRAGLGSLDRVKRVVKTFGLVNATPEFTDHPAVINGASELFAELFGAERGIGARSAVGAGSLPLGVAIEIEMVFEVEEK